MATVVSLNGTKLASPGNPNPDLVESLTDLLQRAKDGEVIAYMAAVNNADGSTGKWQSGNSSSTVQMIGQLERLKFDAIQSLIT